MAKLITDEIEIKYRAVGTVASGSRFGGEIINPDFVPMRFGTFNLKEIRDELNDLELSLKAILGTEQYQEFNIDAVRDGAYLDEGFDIAVESIHDWLNKQNNEELTALLNDYFLGSMVESRFPYNCELTKWNAPVVWVRQF